jgi:hypothetical protein
MYVYIYIHTYTVLIRVTGDCKRKLLACSIVILQWNMFVNKDLKMNNYPLSNTTVYASNPIKYNRIYTKTKRFR